MKRIARYSILLLTELILFYQICYCQVSDASVEKFLRVYSSSYILVPPFPVSQTEISKGLISFRNILPPRSKMKKEWLDVYDRNSQDTILVKMENADFDSIEDYICSSGILDIDTTYSEININTELKRDSEGTIILDEVVMMISGRGSYGYFVETSKRKIHLPVYGGYNFKIPHLVQNFNDLFIRYTRKYYHKNN